MPGAAYAGGIAATGADFALAAPDGRSAAMLNGTSLEFVRGLDTAEPGVQALAGESPAIGKAAWSAKGKALALYLPDSARVQVWTGFDAAPEVSAARPKSRQPVVR